MCVQSGRKKKIAMSGNSRLTRRVLHIKSKNPCSEILLYQNALSRRYWRKYTLPELFKVPGSQMTSVGFLLSSEQKESLMIYFQILLATMVTPTSEWAKW